MPMKFARIALLIFVPLIAFAAPKDKTTATIRVEVVSSKTRVHGNPPHVFSYTDILFTHVDGKNLIFICDQRGDACPFMENGKTYDAQRVGDEIFFMMSTPDSKKPTAVRYKQTGTW
jgi:hypothetical protein